MKTLTDADWAIAEAAVKRVMDTTLSRTEHKQLTDLLGRVNPVHDYSGLTLMGLCAADLGVFGRGITGDPGDEI